MSMTESLETKRQVLVVDDEKTITELLSMLLQTRGYKVSVAHSGLEALQKAANSPDLILLDLILPDIEGFEVCRRLKEQKNTSQIPIIILSSRYLFEDKVEGLHIGADDYLTKPFDYEELFARMEAVMRRSLKPSLEGKEKLILELRKIINEELITPFFQPIYLLRPFQLYGLEVLSRPMSGGIFSNPELVFRSALQFGLYCELEMLSWKKALGFMSRHIKDEKVFLNCNPYLIEGARFSLVKSLFDAQGVSVDNVILELTERSAISDFKKFYEHLQQYLNHGFRIAVDDVGGGYASLESIVKIRPDVVKIDRHIICDVHKDSFKKSIIKAIVLFCKENHIISVAEGIETQEELLEILRLGVDAGQGYLLYRPTSVINLVDMSQNRLGI